MSRREHDLDQEWGELIEENRLAMPGTQVLFAFLLVLPFQQRFERLDDGQVAVYYAALICGAAIAIIRLIAPTAAHRIRCAPGRQGGTPASVDEDRHRRDCLSAACGMTAAVCT